MLVDPVPSCLYVYASCVSPSKMCTENSIFFSKYDKIQVKLFLHCLINQLGFDKFYARDEDDFDWLWKFGWNIKKFKTRVWLDWNLEAFLTWFCFLVLANFLLDGCQLLCPPLSKIRVSFHFIFLGKFGVS